MAPPPAGAAVELALVPPGTEPTQPHHDRDDAKSPRPGRGRGAGARLLSLAVKAAVMAAALALFLIFAAAAAVLLLHLIVAARAFRNHRRSRYRVPSVAQSPLSLVPATPPPRGGLSPAELRLLPSFVFASPRGDTDKASSSCSLPQPHLCAVCIEAGRAGERWRALPACGHAFHAACVDRWLAKSGACPVCRAAVAVTVS